MIENLVNSGLIVAMILILTKIYYKLGKHDILLKFIIQKIDLNIGCNSSQKNKGSGKNGMENDRPRGTHRL